MIDTRLSRWIFASISKHVNDALSIAPAVTLFIEGQYRDTRSLPIFTELRIGGPIITEVSHDFFRIDVDVNIIIQYMRNESNYHDIQNIIGRCISAYTDIILKKYADDDAFFGCLKLQRSINVFNLGEIEPNTGQFQVVLYGTYKTNLTGDI